MNTPSLRAAVFLDRDNTLIHDPGYLRDPDQVRLLAEAGDAVARLKRAGWLVIVVSNQSGVARGLLTEQDVEAVNARMQELLARAGARADAIYYCPFLSGAEAVRPEYCVESELRKPRPGMLLLAAKEHGVDLGRSWMVGDSERDVEAGRAAGCRTILIGDSAKGATVAEARAASLGAAVERILSVSGEAGSMSATTRGGG